MAENKRQRCCNDSQDLELNCQISAVSSSTSVRDIVAAPLLSPTTSADAGAQSHLSFSTSQVKKLNRNKTAGPDGVSPRILTACVDQLCGILQHLFNLQPEPGEGSGAV